MVKSTGSFKGAGRTAVRNQGKTQVQLESFANRTARVVIDMVLPPGMELKTVSSPGAEAPRVAVTRAPALPAPAPRVQAKPAPTQELGILAFYSMAGETSVKGLRQAWQKAGFDVKELPSPPSSKDALTRLGTAWRERDKTAVRSGNAYLFYDISPNGDKARFTQQAKVWIAEDDSLQVEPANHPKAEEFKATYDRLLNNYSSIDMGPFVDRYVQKLGAIYLRGRSHLYYIPPESVQVWHALSGALGASGNHYFANFDIAPTDQSRESLHNAFRGQVEEELQGFKNFLAKEHQRVNSRGLRTRHTRLNSLIENVEHYENILGLSMGDLREEIRGVKDELGPIKEQHEEETPVEEQDDNML